LILPQRLPQWINTHRFFPLRQMSVFPPRLLCNCEHLGLKMCAHERKTLPKYVQKGYVHFNTAESEREARRALLQSFFASPISQVYATPLPRRTVAFPKIFCKKNLILQSVSESLHRFAQSRGETMRCAMLSEVRVMSSWPTALYAYSSPGAMLTVSWHAFFASERISRMSSLNREGDTAVFCWRPLLGKPKSANASLPPIVVISRNESQ